MVSFVDVLFGLKLYLICWFSYCKDWISPSPITVGLQVDLSAVSLFCLTEVIPLRHDSLFSCLFTRGDVGDFLCKHSCVYPRKLQGVFIRLLPWATLRCSCDLSLLQGTVKSTHWIKFLLTSQQESASPSPMLTQGKSLCKNGSNVKMPFLWGTAERILQDTPWGHLTKIMEPVYCLPEPTVS